MKAFGNRLAEIGLGQRGTVFASNAIGFDVSRS
jgi:hypothetical protein